MRAILLLLTAVSALAGWTTRAAPLPGTNVLRIGVTQASFGKVQRNDASAALKAWAQAAVREGRIAVEPEIEIIDSLPALRAAVATNRLHGVSVTSEEFFLAGEPVRSIFLISHGDSCTWSYSLITRRDSGLGGLEALKGRALVRHDSPTTVPALPWLETRLDDLDAGRASTFFSEVATTDTASKAILRVFFKSSAACLVSTRAFQLVGEMTPQLGQQLQVIATSPEFVADLLYFRPWNEPSFLEEVEKAVLDLHRSTTGEQVLTIYQGTRMEKFPVSCLEPTLSMFRRFYRLPGQSGAEVAP